MKNPKKIRSITPYPAKYYLKMILSFCVFLLSMFQLQSKENSLDTKITLHLESVRVEKALKEIESLTDYKILYNDKEVNYKRRVSINVKDTPVSEVLKTLFKGTAITYEVLNSQIIFKTDALKLKEITTLPPVADINIQRTVSGTVSDQGGQPLPGVSIYIEGTTTGTTSDFDGKYTIEAPSDQAVLVYSFIGMTTVKQTVGSNSVINVTMVEDAQGLDEVVVTALGIKQDARKLGYSVAKVDAEEMNVNRSTNFMNTLQGKVAGVNVQSLGTGPGGSSKVRIRGQSSISGTNNPLIVVNGVPIDNTTFGTSPGSTSSEVGFNSGGVTSDGGDGFSSINPDDIESMTILKGATGAALYGSRAKDGVIMITTKTRGRGAGIGVTYNLSIASQDVLDFTDYQYEYGQGENGVRPTTANPTSGQWSFGERFQPGLTQVLFDGIEVPYVPQRNIIEQFYRTGFDITNSVSLEGGGEKGGFNLSLSNLDSEGITPNNDFQRRTVNLGTTYDLSEQLTVSANINYSNEKNTNPPNVGQQDNTIPVALFNLANSMPLDLLEANKFDANGNEFVYSRFRNRTNPFFTLSEQFNNIVRDRFFGNITVKYDILPWLFVQGRLGQDYWSRDQDFNGFPTGQASRPAAPAGFVNGTFTQESRRFRETNLDFLISANKDFGQDFNVGLNLGGNKMNRRTDLNRVDVTDFVIRDLYTVQNGRAKNPTFSLTERAVNSLYAAADISYQDTYYLSGTIRNDWFSTLSDENRSISYPSVSGSYIFSNSFENLPSWLTFGKLRLAYAEVGSDTDVPPFSDALFYNVNANFFNGADGSPQPVAGANTSVLPNRSLRPMRIKETEAGFDLRMFDSRVGLDVSVYRKSTFDQIIPAQVSNTSGFVSTLINSGESRSDGIEAMLTLVPIRSKDLKWDINVNASYNKTKVISLLTEDEGGKNFGRKPCV